MMAMDHQGIIGLDITGYGNYGWATTTPVKTIADAKKVKFRIAEAAVNQLNYKNWGFNPVVMPWPDVPVALKQGVIDGLDHTPMVCNITKKFEVAKYFTQLNYAQGLFIWIFNKAWFNSLPPDLQMTFKEVVRDVCAQIREETRQQELDEIEKAKAAGIEFFTLSDEEMATLRQQGNATHEKYAEEINKLYDGDTYQPDNFLKEVQEHMGYNPE
jgi:TRAP-type C4-dicarboxylate transport system substrate-binding protein